MFVFNTIKVPHQCFDLKVKGQGHIYLKYVYSTLLRFLFSMEGVHMHWTEVISGHFSISFFWLSTNDIEMIFAQICAFQWNKAKRCLGSVIFHFTIFGSKIQKSIFEENKHFNYIFIKFRYRWIQTRLADLKKNTKYLNICQWRIFMIFPHFPIFSKIIIFMYEIIVCVLFHVYMFDQTHYSLIGPFSNENVFKTGIHFRF